MVGVSTLDDRPGASGENVDSILGFPAAACFMPGTSPEVMAEVNRRLREAQEKYNNMLGGEDGGGAYNAVDRWFPGSSGDPIQLDWSFVPDGVFIGSGIGEPGRSNDIHSRLQAMFGSVEVGKDKFRTVFDRWEQLTGIDYTEVSDDGASWGAPGPNDGGNNRGDIRIASKNFGGAWAGVLAYNFFPNNGDMVLNMWHQSDFQNSAGNFRFLRNTVSHENGHGIGLAHVCPFNQTRLMEPAISLNFDMVRHDDLRGGQRFYGDPFEPNNGSSQATDLGAIPSGTFRIESDLSIDDNSDADYFKFTVDPGRAVSVRVSPIGFTYQDFDQLQNGQCANTGPVINSQRMHDLSFQIRDTDGATILTEVDDTGLGDAEEIDDFALPSGGTFFIRVRGSATNDIQVYDIRIDISENESAETLPETVTLVRGLHVSGDLEDLFFDDASRFIARPDVFGPSAIPPIQVEVTSTTNIQAPSELRFLVESNLSVDDIQQEILLWNFNQQQYDLFDTRIATVNADGVVEVSFNDAARYVEDGTGQIRAIVRFNAVAFSIVPTWNARLDRTVWTIVP